MQRSHFPLGHFPHHFPPSSLLIPRPSSVPPPPGSHEAWPTITAHGPINTARGRRQGRGLGMDWPATYLSRLATIGLASHLIRGRIWSWSVRTVLSGWNSGRASISVQEWWWLAAEIEWLLRHQLPLAMYVPSMYNMVRSVQFLYSTCMYNIGLIFTSSCRKSTNAISL